MFEARSVRSRSTVLTLLMSAACVAMALASVQARAQGFGQNKVNYQSFNWRTMHTEHFDIYFYPAESLAVADAAREAERWYVRHSLAMRDTFSKKPIVLYADNPAFQQNNVVGFLTEGTQGVTEPSRSRALLYFSGAAWDDNHVLGHELVHVFQFDIAGGQRGGLSAIRAAPAMVGRGDGRVSVVGPRRPQHDDLHAGRGASQRSAANQEAGKPEILRLPVRGGHVGLHRGYIRRQRHPEHLSGGACGAVSSKGSGPSSGSRPIRCPSSGSRRSRPSCSRRRRGERCQRTSGRRCSNRRT